MKTYTKEQMLGAFRASKKNKEQILQSEICGCFSCKNIFYTFEINYWFPDDPETAGCPYCWMDAVLGDASGYPITKESLEVLNEFWYPGFNEEWLEWFYGLYR